jgi:hypothetical protein
LFFNKEVFFNKEAFKHFALKIKKKIKKFKGELKSTPWGIWGGFNIFVKSTPWSDWGGFNIFIKSTLWGDLQSSKLTSPLTKIFLQKTFLWYLRELYTVIPYLYKKIKFFILGLLNFEQLNLMPIQCNNALTP